MLPVRRRYRWTRRTMCRYAGQGGRSAPPPQHPQGGELRYDVDVRERCSRTAGPVQVVLCVARSDPRRDPVTPTLDRPGDEEAYRFADRHVDSFAAWDLLVFLHHRPGTVEDAAGYAMLLGRSEEDLTKALEHLARTGSVVVTASGSDPRYTLTDDEGTRESLAAFVRLCSIKECRLEIVRRVLSGYPRD